MGMEHTQLVSINEQTAAFTRIRNTIMWVSYAVARFWKGDAAIVLWPEKDMCIYARFAAA
jgi:hypothetical protein